MNLEEYILSGILEQYCLGLTSVAEGKEVEALCAKHEELQKELELVQQTLGNYADNHAMSPNLQLKNSVLYAIDELDFSEKAEKSAEEVISLENPPLIHKKSDVRQWQKLAESLQPITVVEGLPVHPLRLDDKVQLFVVWVDKKVDNESHETESESFLILEGTCVCNVGGIQYDLKAGDFLGIPTYTEHTLKVTSNQPVKFIVQRVQLTV
ncbi:MAG: cupin domain-containing protein [Chitinophagales bacterium]